MKLFDGVHLVGSEQFALSHRFDCNAWLLHGGSGDADTPLVLVDPGRGLDVDAIERNIRADGFDPARIAAVLVTHYHDGHTAGCVAFRDRWGCELWVPEGAQEVLARGTDPGIPRNVAVGMYPAGWSFPTFAADRVLGHGERLRFGALELETIALAGHTPDSMCFLADVGGRRALLTGDALFHLGRIGIVNLPGCSLDDYRRDIVRLRGRGVDALLPGHGVFTVARGQWHVDRAIAALADTALPPSFFETLEFSAETEEADACAS